MARQWILPGGGAIDEDGDEEFVIQGVGVIIEDQATGVSTPGLGGAASGAYLLRRRRRR